jgi:exodeoxyribonuclease VII large subunit
MPETISNKNVFSLHEVAASIQKTLANRYTTAFWVKAEMNKLNLYRHTGHCYPELVEKKQEKIIAQLRSIIWKDDFIRINRQFQEVLKEPLKDGIKLLLLAKVTFDPVYGLSLTILDIDPGYTLGDLEKEKRETIERLKAEDLFDRNKSLKLPLLPARIAVISVETSKGYADFLKVIDGNPWNYKLYHQLFPSLLQGDHAVESLISQLRKIKKERDRFDVVAIIRGGGGDIGLSCYNNYSLAREISEFPLPVITGIGHATNETVVEMVAYTNAITPTKLAEYLLQKFHDFANPLREAERKITETAARLMTEEKTRFHTLIKMLRSATHNILGSNKTEIRYFSRTLLKDAEAYIDGSKNLVRQTGDQLKGLLALKFRSSLTGLLNVEKNIANMSPENVIKRGYSITLLNGRSVKSVAELEKGDHLITILADGKVSSEILTTNKKGNNE